MDILRTLGIATLTLSSALAVADPQWCYSARVRASLAGTGTIILEGTPIGRSLAEAKTLGMQQCARLFPERTCAVAGYAIVDCR